MNIIGVRWKRFLPLPSQPSISRTHLRRVFHLFCHDEGWCGWEFGDHSGFRKTRELRGPTDRRVLEADRQSDCRKKPRPVVCYRCYRCYVWVWPNLLTPNLNRGIHRTIIDAACFYSKVKALNSVGESRSLPLKMTFLSRLQNNRRWWYILEKILTAISSIISSSSRIPRIQARVCLFSNHLYWLFHISSNFCYPSPTHWRASQLETGSFLGPVTLRLAKCERYNFHFCFRCFFTKVIPEANVIYAIYEVWQESGTNWARNLRWSEDGWVGGSTPFLQPHLLSEPITFYPSLARIHLRRALPGSCPWYSFIPSRRFSPTPRSTYYIYLFNLVSASMSSIPFSLLSIFTASFLHSPQPSRNLTLNRD